MNKVTDFVPGDRVVCVYNGKHRDGTVDKRSIEHDTITLKFADGSFRTLKVALMTDVVTFSDSFIGA